MLQLFVANGEHFTGAHLVSLWRRLGLTLRRDPEPWRQRDPNLGIHSQGCGSDATPEPRWQQVTSSCCRRTYTQIELTLPCHTNLNRARPTRRAHFDHPAAVAVRLAFAWPWSTACGSLSLDPTYPWHRELLATNDATLSALVTQTVAIN